jgi:hypothetical protein
MLKLDLAMGTKVQIDKVLATFEGGCYAWRP